MKTSMRWAALSLIALAGISAIRASSMVAASPLSTELCPDGIYIEKAAETVKSWRLLLHGAFIQAEIDNYDSPGSAALISCRYGGESIGIPGSHLAGSYSLSLYREYSHCRFLAAAGARIEQVPDDWGGTKLRCRGARDVCVAVCD